MNHIVLIGFMGCGKTSVGKRLAKRLDLTFVDTDEMIEQKMGMSVSDIFAGFGETYFRQLETEAIKELSETSSPCVISVGGGLPVQSQNKPYLRNMGKVIFLTATVDVLAERLEADTSRPMLQGGDLRKKIISLMEEREEAYREAADLEVDTSRQSFGKIIEKIVENLD